MADWWQEKADDEEDEVEDEDLFGGKPISSPAIEPVPAEVSATERKTTQLSTGERSVPPAAMPTGQQHKASVPSAQRKTKKAKPAKLSVIGSKVEKKEPERASLAPKSALDKLEVVADPVRKAPKPSGATRSDAADGESIDTGTGSLVLGKLLGRGGMAEVRLAHRTGPGGFSRKVVIKRILPEHANDPTFVQRFIREASLAARLHHPNIVEILELGAKEGDYYTVMEYVDGKNLRDVVRKLNKMQQRLPSHLGAQIVSAVAKALDYAHNFTDDDGKVHRIVHRDISPDNIMITFAGETKLIDFGVAKDLDVTSLTLADHVVGKPLYLPPEALKGGKPNQSWDIYGLGVVFYQLLAGRPPFTPGSGPQGLANLLREIVHSAPPPLQEIADDIPDELDRIVRKAMSKDVDERYQVIGEFSREIDVYLSSHAAASSHTLASILADMYGREVESSSPANVVPTPTMRSTELPTGSSPGTAATEAGEEDLSPAEHTATVRRRKRQRKIDPRILLAAGGGAFLLILLVVLIAVVVASSDDGPELLPTTMPVGTTAGLPAVAPTVAPNPGVPVPTPTPTPTAPTPTPAAPTKQGIIQVKCNVAGWVHVDNKPKGLCPLESISVPVGRRVVSLETRSGTKSKAVFVKKNKKTIVDFRPPRKKGPVVLTPR